MPGCQNRGPPTNWWDTHILLCGCWQVKGAYDKELAERCLDRTWIFLRDDWNVAASPRPFFGGREKRGVVVVNYVFLIPGSRQG